MNECVFHPQRNRRSMARSGFTLIELIVVVVILSILAGVIVPKFMGRTEQARIAAAKSDMKNLEGALSLFEVDFSRFPTNEEGLGILIAPPNGKPQYVKSLNDPWGRPYIYKIPGQHNPNGYDLYSQGASGNESGETVNNWTTSQ